MSQVTTHLFQVVILPRKFIDHIPSQGDLLFKSLDMICLNVLEVRAHK